MPTVSGRTNNSRRVRQTPLDVKPKTVSEWTEDESRVKDRIDNRKAATGFWIKTQRPVGRAETKLEGAVDAFGFSFEGCVVMDVGSSTGGFTELALNRGASKVIAVEKGTDQMKAPLRFDSRVELHEKTDIFTVKPELARDVDVFLIDVSFVSIRPVLTYIQEELIRRSHPNAAKRQQAAVARMSDHVPLRAHEVDILAMLKPQFEAKPQDMVRGVVKNEKIRRQITKDFEEWAKRKGFVTIAKHDSDLPGKSGNIERFYWLRLAKVA